MSETIWFDSNDSGKMLQDEPPSIYEQVKANNKAMRMDPAYDLNADLGSPVRDAANQLDINAGGLRLKPTQVRARNAATPAGTLLNQGHGHVHPRPDGAKARCGGPGLCPQCSAEQAVMNQLMNGPSSGSVITVGEPTITVSAYGGGGGGGSGYAAGMGINLSAGIPSNINTEQQIIQDIQDAVDHPPRHIARVNIPARHLLYGIGAFKVIQRLEGIPPGAKVLVIRENREIFDGFTIWLEHESFEPVTEGAEPPLLTTRVRNEQLPYDLLWECLNYLRNAADPSGWHDDLIEKIEDLAKANGMEIPDV